MNNQMTLGELIFELEKLDPNQKIQKIQNPHSYRGYYEDLAFETSEEFMTVKEALQLCKDCLGKVFVGYKGGNWYMDEKTLVWISEHGNLGGMIVEIDSKTGNILTETDD